MATFALVAGVALLGIGMRDSLRNNDIKARQIQTNQLRSGCGRGIFRDRESLELNSDMLAILNVVQGLHHKPSKAIRSKLSRLERRGLLRISRINLRLPYLPGNSAAQRFCEGLYPYTSSPR